MNDSDPDQIKRVLIEARQLYLQGSFQQSKQKLQSINNFSLPVESNLHLIQHKVNKANTDIVLKALIQLLTKENIKLYTERHISKQTNEQRELTHVDHQYLYWNILVISLKIGRPTIASLIANQATYLCGSFRPPTAFFLLLELMKYNLQANKAASCLKAYNKFEISNKLLTKKSKFEMRYVTMCKTIFTRLLLKLGLISQAQSKYMEDFGQQNQMAFDKLQQQQDIFRKQYEQQKLIQTSYQFPFKLIQQFMRAEIQFIDGKYTSSLQILGTIIANQFNLQPKFHQRVRILAENNVGIIMSRLGKKALARKYFQTAYQRLSRLCNEAQPQDSEKIQFFQHTKCNLIYSYLMQVSPAKIQQISRNSPSFSSQHSEAFAVLQSLSSSQSYKLNYRKAQICLNNYHAYLAKNQRHLPWQQIHDSYDTVYYYPNEPYVQQKSKNRNIYFANKRHFYKRYVLLNSWNDSYQNEEQEVSRDLERKKFQKQAIAIKCKEILEKAQAYLRQALIIVENQREISTQKDGFEGSFKQKINEVLFQQHYNYKCSILSILCYVCLCLRQWAKCVKYGQQFLKHKGLQSTEDYFNVLTYIMQAFCELGQFQEAYDITHKLLRLNPKDDILHMARDSISLHTCFYENSSQFNTFFYNLAVLHSRDNHIIDAYNSIQKILNQMDLNPTLPNSNIPLPLVDLLIHYHLRTNNYPAAIQMIKRKRNLSQQNIQIVGNFRPVMNITK